jgi:hypothetical protein
VAEKTGCAPARNPKVRKMSVSHYRSMAAESARKARQSKSLRDISEFCRQRRAYIALAEIEEHVADEPFRNNDEPPPNVPDPVTPSPPVDVRWARIYIER